jgi:uracil-DNA glycosylase
MVAPEADTPFLLDQVRACHLCADLPLGPRPILQLHPEARILVASQAPGRRAHGAGIPFDDPSGDRLRDWLGLDRATFYDPRRLAVLPMGLCFPGTGKGGDLPPRPECAAAWRERLLAQLANLRLTLVIGQYALAWHLPEAKGSLTARVAAWREYGPGLLPLPHPSPRNQLWLKRNPWFEAELVPRLRERVAEALAEA